MIDSLMLRGGRLFLVFWQTVTTQAPFSLSSLPLSEFRNLIKAFRFGIQYIMIRIEYADLSLLSVPSQEFGQQHPGGWRAY